MTQAAGLDDTRLERDWFSGQALYGDDFDAEAVALWFADEQEAYADLAGADRAAHRYGYHAFNHRHGFSKLPAQRRFARALGFGSNFGDELLPLLPRIDRLWLLDATPRFAVERLGDTPVHYVLAQASGEVALPDASIELITCLSVLHHIANVSHVLAELARVLAPGGWLVLREPAISMGDWRAPRRGLTRRERGIPKAWLLQALQRVGLQQKAVSDCQFAPWVRLCAALGANAFDRPLLTAVDAGLSHAFAWNNRYHRTHWWHKLAPSSVAIVAHKPE